MAKEFFLKITFISIICLLNPFILFAESFSGKVVDVHDRDNITVIHLGIGQKIRLSGIDAPEESQDFGKRAKQFLSDKVFNQVVTVEVAGVDRYKRTIGTIILSDGTNINLEMVKNGYAWRYEKYAPNDLTLKRLEAEAKEEKRGLWGHANPIPPWNFRRKLLIEENPVAPLSSGELPIIGNKNSKIYHLPNCDSYSKVSPRNRIMFRTNLEAEQAGYRNARNCHK